MASSQGIFWHCNQDHAPEADGLPPGWCRQSPIDGVALWFGKKSFLFSVTATTPKLATVLRRLTHGKAETFTFRLNGNLSTAPHENSPPIIWLAGSDTGSIELVSVIDSPLDGDLRGLSWLKLETAHCPHIQNTYSGNLYVGFVATLKSLNRKDTHTVTLKRCLEPSKSVTIAHDGDLLIINFRWHAAEIQLSNLYDASRDLLKKPPLFGEIPPAYELNAWSGEKG